MTILRIGGARRSGVLCAAALAIGLALAGAPAAGETMAIAHLYPEDLTNNEVAPALQHFKDLVEAATGGEVEVEIFGAGALGQEVETGRQAQKGVTVQSVLISSGAMSSFYKRYQIVATPFLFESYAHAWAFLDSPWFADFMRGTIEESGLRYLGTFDDGGGFVAMTNNKRLIKTVNDFAGLNIRVEENPAHIATMRALGASATPLPWGEVIPALATGLADGQFNAPVVSVGFKLWEVNDYTTWTGHVYNTVTWLVSEAWLRGLPEPAQRAIVGAARESIAIAHGTAAHLAVLGWTTSCSKFKACHVLADDEREAMRARTRPAFKTWITGDFGLPAGEVEAFWAEVERVRAQVEADSIATYLK
ncbi:MAG TPA: TRAP transporter substrate-binding protein DctP [Alphaproteobacteria bacterium]